LQKCDSLDLSTRDCRHVVVQAWLFREPPLKIV
jgi:hypothetical protein